MYTYTRGLQRALQQEEPQPAPQERPARLPVPRHGVLLHVLQAEGPELHHRGLN